MPNILHVVHDFYDHSMNRITENLVKLLTPQGYTFHIGAVTDYTDMVSQNLRDAGATTVEFFRDPSVRDAIRHYIADHDIALVHSHNPRTTVNATLALRGVPKIKHVSTRHLLTMPQSRRFGLIYTAVDRASLYMPDALIPVSKTMAEQILDMPFIGADKVIPVQNGIDTTRFAVSQERAGARAELGLGDDETVFVYTGRIDLMKRLDLLISAFKAVHDQYPQTRLLIVGKGELERELREQAAALGIAGQVVWAGFRRDVPRMLAAGDIYMQSSSNEGLSLSILEAMAAGKAIVSTDVGAAREVLEQDVTALIVPPLDLEALTEAMAALLASPERARRLASKALEVVNAQFSKEAMADGYRKVYERFIRR
jgi:glycosyltransferase involved in cell wall biosynthesis